MCAFHIFKNINKHQHRSIIQTGKHLHKIYFEKWEIDSEGIEFSNDITYKLNTLAYINCSGLKGVEWKTKPSLVEDIVKAILNCGMKQSLDQLQFMNDWMKLLSQKWEKIKAWHET